MVNQSPKICAWKTTVPNSLSSVHKAIFCFGKFMAYLGHKVLKTLWLKGFFFF